MVTIVVGVDIMIGFDVEDNKPTVTVCGHAGRNWPATERVAVQPEITLVFIVSVGDVLEVEVAVVGLLPVDDFSRTDVDDFSRTDVDDFSGTDVDDFSRTDVDDFSRTDVDDFSRTDVDDC
jgi:hypothetical protein